ncbi:MAG: FprA family A-type flavoprotein [Clostridia bacterium]|nr:FprA family A-type flavoprotein [Clostridia bacterium]
MNDVLYIGVNDHHLDLFEGQYAVPKGMSYNSYVISDEKIAVMDTVDAHFTSVWLSNLKKALGGRKPDYLVVQHMEPDHSAGIMLFAKEYPEATLVATAQAFGMMKKYFGEDFASRRLVVKEKDSLTLGSRKLVFYSAPMVHWPEVMMSYEESEGILFSADAFGKFGALDENEPWIDEARRYYIGIVGKYGVQVQSILKKLSALEIREICPLHGPVLKEDLSYYLNLYQIWSSYSPEEKGVAIFYTSVYGHTEEASLALEAELKRLGCESVTLYDLARSDLAKAVADAFRYDRIVLATTTYNGDVFPFMSHFIHALTERGFQGRTVALMENGSWAPVAAKRMRALLEGCKNLSFTETVVTIHASLDENSQKAVLQLAKELL